MPDSNSIDSLQEALRHSPENVPLRKHLGATLLAMGRTEEAAEVFRDGLALKPESTELKVGLAGVFFSQGKYSHALVIIEDLLAASNPPAEAHLLHAKLQLRRGEVAGA